MLLPGEAPLGDSSIGHRRSSCSAASCTLGGGGAPGFRRMCETGIRCTPHRLEELLQPAAGGARGADPSESRGLCPCMFCRGIVAPLQARATEGRAATNNDYNAQLLDAWHKDNWAA